MNKKTIRALVAVILSASTLIQVAPTAQANSVPAIAILDTALDTSLPIFKDRIAHEVCILEWNSCPNGNSFMEGPGSAVLPSSIISYNGFDHGTQMSSVVANLDPNVKIVFIRIIGNTPNGSRQTANEMTVVNALSWVLANKDKYNIKSIAMSQGHNNFASIPEYCPSTPNTKNLLISLSNAGVATFFPAGNRKDYTRIDWPACITESISIGWSDQYEGVSLSSNFDKNRLDFYALGNTKVTLPGGVIKNGAGSSISVQVAATKWAVLKNKYPTSSQQQLIDLILKTGTPTRGSKGQYGQIINLDAAIALQDQNNALSSAQRTALIEESKKAIELAEAQYQSELKASLDKLNAIKADWDKKING